MDIRRNHRDLTRAQKQALIRALLILKNDVPSVLRPGLQSRYDDFAQVHKNAMGGTEALVPPPHNSPLFYPWHRVFLRQFELALQNAVDDSGITLPYWDWEVAGPEVPSMPFTEDFLGGDGDIELNRVQTGPFALQQGHFELKVWLGPQGDPGLRRNFASIPNSRVPNAAQVDAALQVVPYWAEGASWETVSEGTLHNRVHQWVGGTMMDPASPNDPVFFLHHGYLDLLWERWKQRHPDQQPYLPVSDAPLHDLDALLVFNAPGTPAPWDDTFTVRDTLDTRALGYDYR